MSETNNKLEKESQLDQLLQQPKQIDPQHLERNMKLPLEMCEEGRILLKEKKYLQASKSFAKSVMSFQYLLKNNLLSKQQIKQMFTQVTIPAYSNLSLCHLKLGSYDSVVSFCNQILAHDISNVKAKYRRGLAHHKLKKYDEAIEDFISVSKLDHTMEVQCNQQIKQCKIDIAKEKEKRKKIATAFVENISDPRSSNQAKTQVFSEEKVRGNANASLFSKYVDLVIGCCKKLFRKKSN